jgi:hypothetical protein
MNFASRIGDFTTTNTPLGSSYARDFLATNLTLRVLSAFAINSWRFDTGGDWNIDGNWSLLHVPTPSEIALIDRGAFNPIVTYSATGTQPTVGQLQNAETFTIMPMALRGKIIFGTAGAVYGVRGWIAAINADTGEPVW